MINLQNNKLQGRVQFPTGGIVREPSVAFFHKG